MEAGRKAEDMAREVVVSTHTIYAWKSKYGGMYVSEAQESSAHNCACSSTSFRTFLNTKIALGSVRKTEIWPRPLGL
jgi:hypothetical protein